MSNISQAVSLLLRSNMERHLLPMFISLILMPLLITAALPPELYWKSMLPNTAIPKAVTDLLSAGIVGKAIYENNQMIFWPLGVTDRLHDGLENKILFRQPVTTDEMHDNPISVQTSRRLDERVPTDQTLDESPLALFFSDNDLYPGKKMKLLLTKSPYSKILLPREVADTIPFSLEKLPEIFKMLSVEPGSEEAQTIKAAIHHCQTIPAGTKLEDQHCATSLESMVDYMISRLGKNLKAYSTEVEKENKIQTYTITGVKKISDEVLACHQKPYPFALFHCHNGGSSNKAYFVPLEGSDGTRIKTIVVCHEDTSEWDPNHIAFRILKAKPGTATVCHVSPADNVVWTPQEAV